MKVLVIQDIHLKSWMLNLIENLLKDGKADRAVCLMDIADDWNMQFQIEMYKSTYDKAIDFAKNIRILCGATEPMMLVIRGESWKQGILRMQNGQLCQNWKN